MLTELMIRPAPEKLGIFGNPAFSIRKRLLGLANRFRSIPSGFPDTLGSFWVEKIIFPMILHRKHRESLDFYEIPSKSVYRGANRGFEAKSRNFVMVDMARAGLVWGVPR